MRIMASDYHIWAIQSHLQRWHPKSINRFQNWDILQKYLLKHCHIIEIKYDIQIWLLQQLQRSKVVKCQNASFEQASSSSRVISIKSIKQELVCWLLTRPGNNAGTIKPSHLTTMSHSLWSNPYFEHCSTVFCGNLFDACQPCPFLWHFMSFLSQYLIIQDEQRD